MKKEVLRMDNVITEDDNKTDLSNFNLHIFSGEIMGLIAINEFGKEKLIELIMQNTTIKFGRIYFMEQLVNSYRHCDETNNKVFVLNTTSKLIKDLSVADNVFVLRKGFKKYIMNKRILDVQLNQLTKEMGVSINPRELASNLSEYERCVVEVLKAVIQGVKLFIIHDISNCLSEVDLKNFHQILVCLSKKNYSILYIGNHHQEVFYISDRVALMKDGKIIKTLEKNEMDDKSILPYAISFDDATKTPLSDKKENIISLRNISVGSVKDFSLDIHSGECIVFLNRSNNIHSDLTAFVCGEKELLDGSVYIGGKSIEKKIKRKEWYSKAAIINENPLESMLFYDRSYIDNFCFLLDNKLQNIQITKKVKESIQKEYFDELGEELYEYDLHNLDKLSLYNLVYYRVQLLNPQVVFIIQPFANADMYTRHHIVSLIRGLKRKGMAVVILAVTLSDNLFVADRMILLEEGKPSKEYLPDAFPNIDYSN